MGKNLEGDPGKYSYFIYDFEKLELKRKTEKLRKRKK